MKHDEFIERALQNSNNKIILERLKNTAINDLWLVSGSLFQTVWNTLTNREPSYGIKDYDIFYYDNSDLSWDAEDDVIKKIKGIFNDLNISLEIKNQARVHLWYEKHFNVSYPPLKSSCEAIDRFLTPAAMVGIQPSNPSCLYAPKGLDDISKMVLRPSFSPNFDAKHYQNKVNRWTSTWPELTPSTA